MATNRGSIRDEGNVRSRNRIAPCVAAGGTDQANGTRWSWADGTRSMVAFVKDGPPDLMPQTTRCSGPLGVRPRPPTHPTAMTLIANVLRQAGFRVDIQPPAVRQQHEHQGETRHRSSERMRSGLAVSGVSGRRRSTCRLEIPRRAVLLLRAAWAGQRLCRTARHRHVPSVRNLSWCAGHHGLGSRPHRCLAGRGVYTPRCCSIRPWVCYRPISTLGRCSTVLFRTRRRPLSGFGRKAEADHRKTIAWRSGWRKCGYRRCSVENAMADAATMMPAGVVLFFANARHRVVTCKVVSLDSSAATPVDRDG